MSEPVTKTQPFRRLLEEAFSDEGLELPMGLTDLPPMSSRLLADLDVAVEVDVTDPELPILPSMPSFPSFPPSLRVASLQGAPPGPRPSVPLRSGPRQASPAPSPPPFAELSAFDDDLEDQPTRPLPIMLPATPPVVRLKKQVPRPVSAPKQASPAPAARAAPLDRRITPNPFAELVDDETRVDRRAAKGGSMAHAREPFEGALDATPARARTIDLIVDVVPAIDLAELRSLSGAPAMTPTPSPLPAPAPKPYATGEVRARGEAQRKADALYQQALAQMGAGELAAALKDLKLATVYDPVTPIYRDLAKQIEKKIARRLATDGSAQASTPSSSGDAQQGPALMIISRDGTKRGAPAQAYWTRPKR